MGYGSSGGPSSAPPPEDPAAGTGTDSPGVPWDEAGPRPAYDQPEPGALGPPPAADALPALTDTAWPTIPGAEPDSATIAPSTDWSMAYQVTDPFADPESSSGLQLVSQNVYTNSLSPNTATGVQDPGPFVVTNSQGPQNPAAPSQDSSAGGEAGVAGGAGVATNFTGSSSPDTPSWRRCFWPR